MALRRIGGAPRRKASEANRNKKPCLATLLTLLSLAAWLKRRAIIVRQKTILKHRPRTAGPGFGPIARSTLNRQLAALEKLGYINRLCRHYPRRDGSWHYRASFVSFGLAGIEFVKQLRQITRIPLASLEAVEIPLGRLAVPKTGHNQKDYIRPLGVQRAVDKSRVTPSKQQSRPPRRARG